MCRERRPGQRARQRAAAPGIQTSQAEPLVSLETHKNLEARWRSPIEVWPSFQGLRAPYGVAAQLAWEAADPRQGSTTSNPTDTEGPIPTPPFVTPTPASTTAWTNELWDPQPGTFYGSGEPSYRARVSTSPYSSTFQMREEVTMQLASKIWFVTNEDAMCYHRADSAPDQPQLDTYGGKMEPADKGSHAACARCKLSKDVTLPTSWQRSAERALELDPEGQANMRIDRKDKAARCRIAVWFVRLTDQEANEIPVLILGKRRSPRVGRDVNLYVEGAHERTRQRSTPL